MPVFAQVSPDKEEWYMETSITAGLQAPLKSINKSRLVSAAFSLGRRLSELNKNGFIWITFCRWTPDDKYGMEEHVDETYQLIFTQHGVAVIQQWEQIFVPSREVTEDRPVLIYDYDSWCFKFCDVSHFVPYTEAWTIFAEIFDIEAPPIADPRPDGAFQDINDYMMKLDGGFAPNGDPVRPRFYN